MAVSDATLGICMLNTRFPRIPGDIGNPGTWPFPVRYGIVTPATAENVIQGDPRRLLDEFIRVGRDLVAGGCAGVATTCGFLVPLQDDLAEALGVPVATSSLLQVPMVARALPQGRRVGIVTIDARHLSAADLAAAGVPEDTPVVGTEQGAEFTARILSDAPEMDIAQCRADVVDAARRLVADHPDVGAIVLECTNMVPYAPDVRRATGLPVYSIYSYLIWFQAGLMPRRFAPDPKGAPSG